MKAMAILMAVAMIAMVTPLSSADEECDNEAYWNDVLATRPDSYVRPVVPAHDRVGQTDMVRTEENEASIAETVAELVERTTPFCMEDLVGGAAESGDFPQASEFFLIVEIAYDFSGQHCNQGPEVGDGGHFTIAEATEFENFTWSPYSESEFTGFATSDISITSSAYYKSGTFVDYHTSEEFRYAEPVAYAGVSDFYCWGAYAPEFGDYYTINLPYATGVIVSRA